ncbi:Glycerol kinase-2 [Operophtera brumata]|uniref:glycerol kinase n=1 Tax=Operophtera brumata TaxID=104452 RepID=A0A0L7LU01_OPEBR|nr:Glycerol kinase-2 [Operophtera brumata]
MREYGRFGPLVGAIDEGTSSVKFLVFAANTSEVLTYHQLPIRRFSPQEGWVEQDALEILNAVLECIEVTVDNLRKLDINPEDVIGIGVTNQRETTIVWNSVTGQPLYSAIVDELIKTKGAQCVNAVSQTSGLPLSTYFSSVKLKWLLKNVTAIREAVAAGECMAGTVDSWIIWLMSLRSLQWDKGLLRFFDIPEIILPEIKSSAEVYGYIATGSLMGCLGDQQAALVGQGCMRFGQVKCTFGTGCFLLYNTGDTLQWLRDGLQIINDVKDTESMASEVSEGEEGSICFIPAFNGLTRRRHVVRAALEAVCHQTASVAAAMGADCAPLRRLLADGGMAQNAALMHMQADVLGIPLIRPLMTESTALGAAIVAGRALRVWPTSTPSPPADTFLPSISSEGVFTTLLDPSADDGEHRAGGCDSCGPRAASVAHEHAQSPR